MARTLIIGDVHGCSAELADLLDAVAFGAQDTLYCVGDLVARGPDTLGVLRLARELGARSVRGNHEQRLLDARQASLSGAPMPRLSPSHEALLHALGDADWSLLEALPLWLDLPEHDLCVVHAGVDPRLSIAEQAPWTLLHLRSLRPDGTPSHELDGVPWASVYQGRPHIAFGHNARLRLQLHPHATGLDTGCVYGGSLTALVLGAGERVPPPAGRRDVLRAVPARRAYYSGHPGMAPALAGSAAVGVG